MKNADAIKSIRNILLSFFTQVVLMAIGLVLPRLYISTFGSNGNGFLSTVNQVFTYLELLRAGMGMAAMQALYYPIIHGDSAKASEVVSTSRSYFKKLGRVYLLCVLAIAVFFTVKGDVSFFSGEVFAVVLIQGISGWLTFSKISWFSDLLRAEGKNYIILTIQTGGKIIAQLLQIVVVITTHNVVLTKLAELIIIIIEVSVFRIYRKKKYRHLNFNSNVDISLLKDRKSYLFFHIAGLICTSTDTFVISMFCGYELASVYAVYYLVTSAVNAIINTVYSSTQFLLGHSYQKGLDTFRVVHDGYYIVYSILTTSLFSACYCLMPAFVRLYTADVADVNYQYKWLPFLFCLVQILTCGKNVGDMTINVGGKARNVVSHAAAEAAINIVLSVILVQFFNIYGVLIGTVVALSYRMLDVMIFSSIHVLKRSPLKNILIFVSNIVFFAIVVLACKYIPIEILTYKDFILAGVIITPVLLVVNMLVQAVVNLRDIKKLLLIRNCKRQVF